MSTKVLSGLYTVWQRRYNEFGLAAVCLLCLYLLGRFWTKHRPRPRFRDLVQIALWNNSAFCSRLLSKHPLAEQKRQVKCGTPIQGKMNIVSPKAIWRKDWKQTATHHKRSKSHIHNILGDGKLKNCCHEQSRKENYTKQNCIRNYGSLVWDLRLFWGLYLKLMY